MEPLDSLVLVFFWKQERENSTNSTIWSSEISTNRPIGGKSENNQEHCFKKSKQVKVGLELISRGIKIKFLVKTDIVFAV